VTPKLLAAYRRTLYVVGDKAVRIGQRSEAGNAVLITAWNPHSRRMPAGWNQRMQTRLIERLRSTQYAPATGAGRRWAEDHVMVAMPVAKAAVLARRFRQNAIVVLRRGQKTTLLILNR
jgi:hypothetical protein